MEGRGRTGARKGEKMHSKKKVLAVLMALVLALQGAPTASAEGEDRNGNGVPDENEYCLIDYQDGLGGEVFQEEWYENCLPGDTTPAFSGSLDRPGWTFTGWSPEWSETVTESVYYTAQWAEASTEFRITSLRVENVEYYLDELIPERYFEPKTIHVSTTAGDFSGRPEDIIWNIRSALNNYDLEIDCGVQNLSELTWAEGTHTVSYFYGDQTASYEVTVNGPLIQTVTVKDRVIPLDSIANPEGGYVYQYAPSQIDVKLADGMTYSGTPDDVAMYISWDHNGFWPAYGIDNQEELKEGIGEHTVKWHFGEQSLSYTVKVIESMIASVEAEDMVTFAEYFPIEKMLDGYYIPRAIKVTLTDGKSFSGLPEEVSSEIQREYGCLYTYQANCPDFPFGAATGEEAVGEYSGAFSFGYGGQTVDYSIKIMFLIKSLEKRELRYFYEDFEKPQAYFSIWSPQAWTGDYIICSPIVEVTTYDGEVYSGYTKDVQHEIYDKYVNFGNLRVDLPVWGDMVGADDVWEPGTYHFTFSFMHHDVDLTVYVMNYGDANGDGLVDEADVEKQMDYLTSTMFLEDTPVDTTNDGRTNAADLLKMLQDRESN